MQVTQHFSAGTRAEKEGRPTKGGHIRNFGKRDCVTFNHMQPYPD